MRPIMTVRSAWGRPFVRPFDYDPGWYDTHLGQLGIEYPTVRWRPIAHEAGPQPRGR